MAMSAAAVMTAKKVAAMLLTKKKTWIFILSVLAGVLMIVLLPIMILLNISGNLQSFELDEAAAQEYIMANLTSEQLAQIEYSESVMSRIENEITAQSLDVAPAKAGIIYLCSLENKEKESDTFYSDYISCFADVQNDSEIFGNITAKFGVVYTAEDIDEITSLFQLAAQNSSSGVIP